MIYTIIGVIFLILALILLLILFIPFHISFYLNKREKDIRGNFKLIWLKIPLLKRTIPSEKEKKEEKKKEPEKKRKVNIDEVFNVINKFQVALKHLIPILCAFFRSIKFEKLYLNLSLGFSSPVNTALFSGYFWSISSIINIIPPINLSITPDFQKTRYDGSLDFEVSLTLYRIVWALLKALTKRSVWELIWSIRKLSSNKEEKKEVANDGL